MTKELSPIYKERERREIMNGKVRRTSRTMVRKHVGREDKEILFIWQFYGLTEGQVIIDITVASGDSPNDKIEYLLTCQCVEQDLFFNPRDVIKDIR